MMQNITYNNDSSVIMSLIFGLLYWHD